MTILHSILQEQLARCHIDVNKLTPEFHNLLKVISIFYNNNEELSRYQTLVDNLPIGILRTDVFGNILEINPAFVSMLEAPSKEELMKHNISEFYQYIEERESLIEMLKQNGLIKNTELTMRTFKGKVFNALLNIVMIKDNLGNTTLDGIVQDITEQKGAQKKLLEDKQLIKEAHGMLETRVEERTRQLELTMAKDDAILSSIGDGVWVLNPEGKVLLINAAAQKMLGLTAGDILNKLITTIKMEDKSGNYLPLEKRPAMIAMATKNSIYITSTNPVFFYRKDNTKFPVALVATPIFINEQLVGAVAVFRDITKENELDEQKNEFIAIASHELRTPLTAIDGIISMIRSGEYGPVNENLRQPLDSVNNSSERLIHLVNDLLNLSHIQKRQLKYNLSDFLINERIDYTIKLLTSIAQQKKLLLKTDYIDNVSVQGDIEKSEEVIENLIANAINFTDKGEITIMTKISDDMLEISIKDTGIGIAQEDHQKLFRKFSQIEINKGRPAGTGLGLYISREIARAMGGNLRLAKSSPGEGATFIFSLPLTGTGKAKRTKLEIEKE